MMLYVVRHGQTNVNLEERINSLNDDDLNDTGINQAKELYNKFKNIDYDLIIASPLTRTIHTAKLLNYKNKTIITDDRIIERNAGVLTKHYIKELNNINWWGVDSIIDYEGVENINSMKKRVFDFLDEIKIKYKNDNIVIVTHGGTSKIIRMYFDGIPENNDLSVYKHDNCDIQKYIL